MTFSPFLFPLPISLVFPLHQASFLSHTHTIIMGLQGVHSITEVLKNTQILLPLQYLIHPNMDKYSKEQEIKERLIEGYCKESNDFDATKHVSSADDILPHILNLYASRATPKDFEIYAPHATFEDPLMCAHGIKQIKSAFYSLSKAFSESRILEYSIEEHEISPEKKEILIDNKQYYKFLGRDINMVSLIKLQLENGKIVRHEDWWDKKPLWNRETVQTPLLGRITEISRRASMLATHALMRFGKDPST